MINEILPSYIDSRYFRYIKLDEKIISSFAVKEYPKYIDFMQFMQSLPQNFNYDLGMYIKKQDVKKVLKDITYNLAGFESEIKTSSKNQIDIDIINKTKSDAAKIREQIQVNNQEIYAVYTYFTIYSENTYKDQFELLLKNFESKLYSKQIILNASNFRQLETYITTLPLNYINKRLQKENYRYLTTTNLSYMFPFCTSSIFDPFGVIFRSQCLR